MSTFNLAISNRFCGVLGVPFQRRAKKWKEGFPLFILSQIVNLEAKDGKV